MCTTSVNSILVSVFVISSYFTDISCNCKPSTLGIGISIKKWTTFEGSCYLVKLIIRD